MPSMVPRRQRARGGERCRPLPLGGVYKPLVIRLRADRARSPLYVAVEVAVDPVGPVAAAGLVSRLQSGVQGCAPAERRAGVWR